MRLLGGMVLGISAMFASVPVVAQAAGNDRSQCVITVPVNDELSMVRPVFLATFLMGRSYPEKIETVNRH